MHYIRALVIIALYSGVLQGANPGLEPEEGFEVVSHFPEEPEEEAKPAYPISFSYQINRGVRNVNARSTREYASPTELNIAIQRGNIQTVQGLLKAGANPNITDDLGDTALHDAAFQSNSKIIEALLTNREIPANPNLANHNGYTPLGIVVHDSSLNPNAFKSAQILLENRTDMNAYAYKNQTPIQLVLSNRRADEKSRKRFVILLLRYGANFNQLPKKMQSDKEFLQARDEYEDRMKKLSAE